jgi:hypothetical protein
VPVSAAVDFSGIHIAMIAGFILAAMLAKHDQSGAPKAESLQPFQEALVFLRCRSEFTQPRP